MDAKRNKDEDIRLLQMHESTIKEYKKFLKAAYKSHNGYEKMLKEIPESEFGGKYNEIVKLVKEDADIIKEMEAKLAEIEKKRDEFKLAIEDEGNYN